MRNYFVKRTLYVFLLIVLTSCASNKVVEQRRTPEISLPQEVNTQPETTFERLPLPKEYSFLESAIVRIKRNDPAIKKYFVREDDGNIIIKADINERNVTFYVIYDLKNARLDRLGRFEVPFLVQNPETEIVFQDTFFWNIQKDSSGVLLAFDDDYYDVWERNLDIFDRHSARVTFFVQGNINSFSTSVLKRGHDVGYHSLNHLNLPKVSREVFIEETLSPLNSFRSAGVPLNSFAYPYGLFESWMHDELLKSFNVLRGYGVMFRLYDIETIRKGYISSIAIDNIIYKDDENFKDTITFMLRATKFIGGVLPLTTHTISDTADWAIKAHRLEYLLQSIKDLLLEFYCYRDFF